MHEMSIASALVEQACFEVQSAGGARLAEINVRMGALSAISRALYFCFPSAARGTACEGATLNIEEVPLTVLCSRCDAVKTPAGLYNFRCPDCGWPTPKVLTGREMQLVSLRLVPASGTEAESQAPFRASSIQKHIQGA